MGPGIVVNVVLKDRMKEIVGGCWVVTGKICIETSGTMTGREGGTAGASEGMGSSALEREELSSSNGMSRGGETNVGGGWVAVGGAGAGGGDGEGAGRGRPAAEEEGAEERGWRRYGLMGRDGACDGGTFIGWRR